MRLWDDKRACVTSLLYLAPKWKEKFFQKLNILELETVFRKKTLCCNWNKKAYIFVKIVCFDYMFVLLFTINRQ